MCRQMQLETVTGSGELVEQGLVVLGELRATQRVNEWVQSRCQLLNGKRNVAEHAPENVW